MFVGSNEEKTKYCLKVLRDSGAAQSLILKTAVPKGFVFSNDEFVVLGGFPNSIASYPLETFNIHTRYFKGTAKLAVVDSLPVPGIHLLLGNDLVEGEGENDDICPILTLLNVTSEDCENNLYNPVSVVTRSRAREVDLEDFELDLGKVDRQRTDMRTRSSSVKKNMNWDDVNWDAKGFKMAQNKEFSNLELGNPEDLTKPVFVKEEGLLYRLSRSVNAPAHQVESCRQLVVPESTGIN